MLETVQKNYVFRITVLRIVVLRFPSGAYPAFRFLLFLPILARRARFALDKPSDLWYPVPDNKKTVSSTGNWPSRRRESGPNAVTFLRLTFTVCVIISSPPPINKGVFRGV